MVLWFLPLLWPSPCKIHWHLLPFNSPRCPRSIFYSFSRQHWVPPLSYLGLGNPLPWSVPWTPGVFLGAAALNLTWVLVQNAGSQVPRLTHRIGTWWGGTVQTVVSMISQVILMHTELWEALLLTPATQRVAPGPEDLALPGSLRELWPLSPIPEVWVRICMSSGFQVVLMHIWVWEELVKTLVFFPPLGLLFFCFHCRFLYPYLKINTSQRL